MKTSTLTLALSLISFAATAASRAQQDPAAPKLTHAVPATTSTLALAALGMAAVGAVAWQIAAKKRAPARQRA